MVFATKHSLQGAKKTKKTMTPSGLWPLALAAVMWPVAVAALAHGLKATVAVTATALWPLWMLRLCLLWL